MLVTLILPLMVEVPKMSAFVSCKVRLLPLVIVTVPKSLVAEFKVTSWVAPATRVIVPGMVRVPLWVMPVLEVEVKVKLPVVLMVPKASPEVPELLTKILELPVVALSVPA